MRASAVQLRFRRNCDRRCHVVCAYSVARPATASCHPLNSESAQNWAASLTRPRFCSLRDGAGDGLGGCCRYAVAPADAWLRDEGGTSATRGGPGLSRTVAELCRVEVVARGLAVFRVPRAGAPGPPWNRQAIPGRLTGCVHGFPSLSLGRPHCAIPRVCVRLVSCARLGPTGSRLWGHLTVCHSREPPTRLIYRAMSAGLDAYLRPRSCHPRSHVTSLIS